MTKEELNLIYPNKDYDVKIDQEALKRDINMVIIGNVDSGKSTLMGHILHKMG